MKFKNAYLSSWNSDAKYTFKGDNDFFIKLYKADSLST